MENQIDESMKDALTNVRRAYRLVYEYQRRVADLLEMLHRVLEQDGLEFEQWRPIHFNPPGRKQTRFFQPGTWAWDLLPGYAMRCRWTGRMSEARECRVVVEAIADTGFAKDGSEPTPSSFAVAEECESGLDIGLWIAERTGSHEGLWTHFIRAWDILAVRPDYTSGKPCTVALEGIRYTFRNLALGYEELATQPDLEANLLTPIGEWLRTATGAA